MAVATNHECDDCRFMQACGRHDRQWRDGRQHDAQQYLCSILEAMQVRSAP